MCDNICANKKKYTLGPVPYFSPPPPVVGSYPCEAVTIDTPIYEPIVEPVIKNIVQNTTINIPKIQYKEKIVEVPKVEYRHVPVVKTVEAPIYQDKIKFKDVEVPQKQYRIKPIYKVVDVPQIEYVDKYVKKKYKRFKYVPKEVPMPFRPKREIYTEVPVPRYIPQTMEPVIHPEVHNINEYVNELPLYEGYNDNIIGMLNPFKSYEQKKSKCCLDKFKKKDEIISYPYMPEAMYPMHNLDYYSNDGFGYSIPFVVEEENKNTCNCLIETTANVLALSGIAIILLGKFTIDGINYLFNKNKSDNENKQNNELVNIEEQQITKDYKK